jgi:hypothetical protein
MSNYPDRLVQKDGTVIRPAVDPDSLRRQAHIRRERDALARLIFEVESTT